MSLPSRKRDGDDGCEREQKRERCPRSRISRAWREEGSADREFDGDECARDGGGGSVWNTERCDRFASGVTVTQLGERRGQKDGGERPRREDVWTVHRCTRSLASWSAAVAALVDRAARFVVNRLLVKRDTEVSYGRDERSSTASAKRAPAR